MNQWAHKVNIAKKEKAKPRSQNILQPQKTKPKVKAVITSCVELGNSPFIKPLNHTRRGIEHAYKMLPSSDELKPGEQWVLLDSGANVDAADIHEHFADFVPFIEAVPEAPGAESACGGVVRTLGSCKVTGSIEDTDAAIRFRHMKVKVPIASLRNRVKGKGGSDIFITEDGGIMRNRVSGRSVRIYDRGGVYFFKFKPELKPQGFQRQG